MVIVCVFVVVLVVAVFQSKQRKNFYICKEPVRKRCDRLCKFCSLKLVISVIQNISDTLSPCTSRYRRVQVICPWNAFAGKE